MKSLPRLFLVAGVVLFVWLLFRIGPSALAANVRLVGWRLPLLVALGLVTLFFDTLGWRFAIPPEHRNVPFRTLAAMRMAGDAVNYVTPSAAIGGEVVRVALLRRFIPATAAAASVALLVIAQFFSQALFVAMGAAFYVPRLAGGRWAMVAVVPLTALATLLAGLVFLMVRSDAFRSIDRFARRIPWLARVIDPAEAGALDEAIFGAFRRRPADLALAVLSFLAAWFVGVVEAFLILRFLGAPVSWGSAIAIESLSVLIETAFFFVPAKMGTQEGGKVAIFVALGLDASKGFALGFVRRLRELAWAFFGLWALLAMERRARRAISGGEARADSGPDPA